MPSLGKGHDAASSSGREQAAPFGAKISSPGPRTAGVETIKLIAVARCRFPTGAAPE